jgi:hypothetical protein
MPVGLVKRNLYCHKKGALHLLLLLIIALSVVIAVPVLIKSRLVTFQNGKIAFNFPSKSKVLAETTQSAVYQPQEAGEPAFSIDPPQGWTDTEKDNIYQKLFFESPDKDEIKSGIYSISNAASLQVTVQKTSATNLEEAAAEFKSGLNTPSIKATIAKERKTKLAGNDAMYYEITATSPSLGTQFQNLAAKQGKKLSGKDVEKFVNLFSGKVISYVIFKNGYIVQIGGTGLSSGWSKHVGQIQSAISTFKFLGEENSPSPSPSPTPTPKPTPVPTPTAIPTPTPSSATSNFDFKPPAGWKKTSALTPAYAGKSTTISYQSPNDPHTFVSIVIKPSPDKTYDKIISDFKYNQAFHKAKITRKNINGLEGWSSTYSSTGAPSITYHNYEFKSYKNGYEISILAISPAKTWSGYENAINKAIDSFKLVN